MMKQLCRWIIFVILVVYTGVELLEACMDWNDQFYGRWQCIGALLYPIVIFALIYGAGAFD